MRRVASPSDLSAVHALYTHEAVIPYLAYERLSLEEFEPVFAELLESGRFVVWEVEGAIAGFYRTTRWRGRASHVALLGTVAVDPRWHGHGVAQAMLTDAIRRLEAEGVLRVELHAEADNPKALRFYEKLGFVAEGRLRKFYKRAADPEPVDEIAMGLLLGSLTRS